MCLSKSLCCSVRKSSLKLHYAITMKVVRNIYYVAVPLFLLSTCRAAPQSDSVGQCSTPIALCANKFGASLTKALGGQDNLFISPMSIFTALSMVYLGAGGKTAQQMEDTLELTSNSLDKTQLKKAIRDFLDVIKGSNDKYQLSLANALYLQQEFNINQQYVNDVQNIFDATVENVDFAGNGVAVKDEINTFIAKSTNNKIDNFLEEPLSPSTVLALFNAIYFKGTWKIQFPEEKTTDGLFTKTDGTTKSVKLMTLREQEFNYFEDRSTNYKFLELPYKGGDISMLLALPESHEQIPDLDMIPDLLCRINGSMWRRELKEVVIPKFQLRYKKGLVDVLQQLGIQDLFGHSADLTGIRDHRDIAVSSVLHEAVIDVNEEGSEAAAVTGVIINRLAVLNTKFIADHPFLFYIIDTRNGLILFSGRVSDP